MLDFHRGGAHEHVVAMQHAFRLARSSRGKEQLRERIGLTATCIESGGVDAHGL